MALTDNENASSLSSPDGSDTPMEDNSEQTSKSLFVESLSLKSQLELLIYDQATRNELLYRSTGQTSDEGLFEDIFDGSVYMMHGDGLFEDELDIALAFYTDGFTAKGKQMTILHLRSAPVDVPPASPAPKGPTFIQGTAASQHANVEAVLKTNISHYRQKLDKLVLQYGVVITTARPNVLKDIMTGYPTHQDCPSQIQGSTIWRANHEVFESVQHFLQTFAKILASMDVKVDLIMGLIMNFHRSFTMRIAICSKLVFCLAPERPRTCSVFEADAERIEGFTARHTDGS
ncbi:uncharacterized protein BYT42DRAFT_616009 [Radiomyces spectabilis]|uniref:uncharacterized protein n=1 Tax=Radiomyces spectabilis TaxID=64574 RepID=UPI00221F21EC|nr:uncharacterized protein BYT42DRAFT_616009 [Radiomyces spectabilis]KAI8372802.1 hypothetical protein BYT42DRAFT_616009 [Radiomyces spectabilis]